MQVFIATLTFCCIAIFVCTEAQVLELIMDFSGIAVFSELDDWLGEQICTEQPHAEHDDDTNDKYDLSDKLNDRMKLPDKMSMLQDDLDIIDNQNYLDKGFFRKAFSALYRFDLLWKVFPLSVLILNYTLKRTYPMVI